MNIGILEVFLWFSSVIILLDVHFPGGVIFLKFLNEIVGEGLIALHGDECVAEEIKLAAIVISFDDSR